MRRGAAVAAKIRRRGHDALAEMAEPQVVHRYAGGKRVRAVGHPAGECEATPGAAGGISVHRARFVGCGYDFEILLRVGQCLLRFGGFLPGGFQILDRLLSIFRVGRCLTGGGLRQVIGFVSGLCFRDLRRVQFQFCLQHRDPALTASGFLGGCGPFT